MRLELREVRKAFDQKQVLKGASFVFEKGKIYGLLGRNGAGKTTLFNCISKELGRQHFSIVSAKRFPVTVRLRYMTERMIFWTFHKSDLHMRIRFYQNF